MPKETAGLLIYKREADGIRVFLVHPGGPFWAKKDLAAWSIPKGEPMPAEGPLGAAIRELGEETGQELAAPGAFLPLGKVRQAGGKTILAWAVEGEIDADAVTSNEFSMEWPRRSGRMQSFPEVDRGAWFTLDEARRRINPGQIALLDELERALAPRPAP